MRGKIKVTNGQISRVERKNQKDLRITLFLAMISIVIFIIFSVIFFFYKKEYVQGIVSVSFFAFLFYYVIKGYKSLSKVDSLNIIVKYIFLVVVLFLLLAFPKVPYIAPISSYFSIAMIADVVIYLVKIYWYKSGQIDIK